MTMKESGHRAMKEALTESEKTEMLNAREKIVTMITQFENQKVGGPEETITEGKLERMIIEIKQAIAEFNQKFILAAESDQKSGRVELFPHGAAGISFESFVGKEYLPPDERNDTYQPVNLCLQLDSNTNRMSVKSSDAWLNRLILNLQD